MQHHLHHSSSILFGLLSIVAFKYDLILDAILLGVLAFLSFMNHSKIVPLPVFFYVLDKLYAHLFAIFYAVCSIWFLWVFSSWLFVVPLVIGLLSSAVYYFKLLPHICVHIGVFLAGITYLFAMKKLNPANHLSGLQI